jgi:uncharacterized protein YdeI (YjbR/CyaY-like superfamily)
MAARRHTMPDDVSAALTEHGVRDAYAGRPAYQRNDYVGWIAGAKRTETRSRRIAQMVKELKQGGTYMKMPWRPRRAG